jgi:hypothetical protein
MSPSFSEFSIDLAEAQWVVEPRNSDRALGFGRNSCLHLLSQNEAKDQSGRRENHFLVFRRLLDI